MILQEMHKRFLDFEKKYDLFNKYYIEEIPLWILIRFPVWSSILMVNKFQSTRVEEGWSILQKKKITTGLQKGINILKGTIFRHPYFGLKEADILFLNSTRRVKLNDNYYDIYLDYLEYKLNEYRCFNLVRTGGQKFNSIPVENYRLLDYIHILTFIKSFLIRKDEKNYQNVQKILQSLAVDFDVQIDIEEETKRLYFDKILNFIEYKNSFERILKKIKPKIVFEVSHYGIINIALNIAANKLKIPTIELQHGVIDQYHVGYNYPNLSKTEKYLFLPTHIFLFGNYWKKHCKIPIEEKNKIVTGFPYFEKAMKECYQYSKNIKQILFISQWTIGDRLARTAYELSSIVSNDYSIVFKLHPAEYLNWEEKYKLLINIPNVKVVDGSIDMSLYRLLAESSFLVGVYSTAIYEGFSFHLQTFILDFPGREYMDHLIKSGYVQLVTNAEEILQGIHKSSRKVDNISDQIWQKDSLLNMKVAIKSILRNS
jgi:hypothetical protein